MAETSEVAAPVLTLEAVTKEGCVVVACKGVLNSTNSGLLKAKVKGYLPETKRIVLDLTELSQMDSSGLGAIVGVYISAKNAGATLEVINLSARVRQLFSLANLISLFEPCGRYGVRFP